MKLNPFTKKVLPFLTAPPERLCTACTEGNTDLVKHLLTCGTPINSLNSERCTALVSAIRSEKVSLAHSLLDRGAAVKVVDLSGYSPLSEAERLNLDRSLVDRLRALDQGWSQEVRDRKVLANRFGLGGLASIEDQSFRIKGLYKSHILQIATQSALAFYRDLIADIKGKGDLWNSIIDSIPVQDRASASAISSKTMTEILGQIPALISQSLDHHFLSAAQIQNRVASGQILPMLCHWPGHMTAAVIDSTQVSLCNKGDRSSGVAPGIHHYSIGRRDQIGSVVKKLGAGSKDYFTSGVHRDLELRQRAYTAQRPQYVGNCGITSEYSMELALLIHLLTPQLGSKRSQTLALAIKKVRAGAARSTDLRNYLDKHQDQGAAHRPDLHLLGRILAKPKTDTKQRFEWVQMISKWAQANLSIESRQELERKAWENGIDSLAAAQLKKMLY